MRGERDGEDLTVQRRMGEKMWSAREVETDQRAIYGLH